MTNYRTITPPPVTQNKSKNPDSNPLSVSITRPPTPLSIPRRNKPLVPEAPQLDCLQDLPRRLEQQLVFTSEPDLDVDELLQHLPQSLDSPVPPQNSFQDFFSEDNWIVDSSYASLVPSPYSVPCTPPNTPATSTLLNSTELQQRLGQLQDLSRQTKKRMH